MKNQIFKNTSILLLSQSIGKVSSFFYTVFLVKNLNVENFGFYILALSYFSIFSAIADFGFSRFLIRESIQKVASLPSLISNILVLRIILTVFSLVFFSFSLRLLDHDSLRVNLILLSVLAVLPQTLALTLDSSIIALQKFSVSALGILVLNLANIIFGVYLVILNHQSYSPILAIFLSQFIYLLFFLFISYREKIFVNISLNFKLMKNILVGSLPYGILTILGLIYLKVDTLVLAYLTNSYSVGIYGAGYKFLEAALIIPSTTSIVLFPILSGLTKKSQSTYQFHLKTLFVLFGISVICMAFFIWVLPILIYLIIPKYISSISVVKILGLSLPFFFMNAPQAALLLSQKRFLNSLILISTGVIAFNFILNFSFIPKYSYLASAWVTVLTEILIFVIFFFIIRKNFQKKQS
ncbi:oligosaccharide flippase family protein [Candidatus Daviesbacteria bacterium]|nr:oligosaccharide flippase family protein [Candidatus Daviesbacteria bacterium]